MSDLFKKPYEISLWDEEFVYVITEGADAARYETTVLPQNVEYTVLNRYIKETKIAVIGSSVMSNPICVFDTKLTQNVNGTNTLTFQLNYKFYDEDLEDFRLNPYLDLLANERKVKLFYDGEWFDFIIKEVKEKSDGNVFTYTCKDLYINELSKTGYSLEFDTELENNQGTIIELGEKILEDSDWEIDKENSELIQQKEKENLCVYQLQSDLNNIVCMSDFSYGDISYLQGDIINLPAGSVIYVFYSSYANKENPAQFLWYDRSNTLEDSYVTDQDGFILNSPNWSATLPNKFFEEKHRISDSFFGEKLISKHLSKYVSEIDKYCYIYSKDGKEYYCYSETEYASISEVQNFLVNSNNFISTNGWVGITNNSGTSTVSLSNITSGTEVYKTLQINFGGAGAVINGGLYDNRRATQGFVAGQSYVFALKYSGTGAVSGAKITGQHSSGNKQDVEFFTFNKYSGTIPSSLSGYTIFEGICKQSVSYDELLNYNIDFVINGSGIIELIDAKLFKKLMGATELIVPDLQTLIDSISKTKYYFFTRDQIDGVTPQEVFGIDDIVFSAQVYEDDLLSSGYEPVYSTNYEKIRSIKGSKSNRFNLIQSLCEAFECWAKFVIDHDEIGKTTYEYLEVNQDEELVEGKTYYIKLNDGMVGESKDFNFKIAPETALYSYIQATGSPQYPTTYYTKNGSVYEELLYNEGNFDNIAENPLGNPVWSFKSGKTYYVRVSNIGFYRKRVYKNVVFKKYVGQDNPVGFRYGINLKSVQRTVKSDQITSKLIVEPNTNQFAKDGGCTIQHSILNPIGENVVYNFEYFIRHKLLDRESLNDDLYGTNGGLGLYEKLRTWNNQTIRPIEELAAVANTLNVLTSRRLTYSTIVSESEDLYNEAIAEIMTATGLSNSLATVLSETEAQNSYGKYAKEWVVKRKEAKSSKERYEAILANTTALISGYNQEYAALTHKLNLISKRKKALNSEFYKKYSRFIQEGTWTSADHIDPEDYYLDAQRVSYSSAFPQITYTINVLEISQIEGYEPYKFKIGDKTYMEDTEFFGWNSDGRPYQEEIIVSEVTYSLDDPSKNTIKVQNYKTQFEDLFQRVVATSQSLQFHEGEYQRAANAINPDGSIKSSLLQESLKNNSLLIKNAKEESVFWDQTGITISNFVNPNNIVRLTSGGIVLTSDGGRNWTTGITGEGINANVITTGRLDTNRIRIFNAEHQTFEWNSEGISAYRFNEVSGVPNYSQFVRFNQYGLFGFIGDDTGAVDSLANVRKNASFSLTWEGLKINIKDQDEDVINIGDGAFVVKGNGTVGIKTPQKLTKNDEIINVNENFKVFGDGSILANSGTFRGDISGASGSFSGTIKAAKFEGASTGAIFGPQLGVGLKTGTTAGVLSNYNFQVDGSGNVTMKGSINLSGTINWGTNTKPLSQTEIESIVDSKIPSLPSLPNYLKTTYIDSTTVYSPKIIGQIITLGYGYFDFFGNLNSVDLGGFILADTTTGVGVELFSSRGGLKLTSAGNVSIAPSPGINPTTGKGYYVVIGTGGENVSIQADLIPSSSTYTCGTSNYPWADIYASSGMVNTSDREKKNSIDYSIAGYEKFFDALKPCTFKMNDGTSGRKHFGLISQEVEEALSAANLTSLDFAGFIKSPKLDENENIIEGEFNYGLRYSEFIGLCIAEIQRLKTRIKELESKI